jgi:DNA-directed RNA polymerase specialized sigma24 family protein
MLSVLEELTDTILRLQAGASPQDFSALAMMLQSKRYSEISKILGMSQEEANEAVVRAIQTIRRFSNRLSHSKSGAALAKE